jgi:hypothetical protein
MRATARQLEILARLERSAVLVWEDREALRKLREALEKESAR